jgi:hypothetical protein
MYLFLRHAVYTYIIYKCLRVGVLERAILLFFVVQ